MPISTQMKKEEAAFRKIVKQSRIARDEAASRQMKQKKQQRQRQPQQSSAAAAAAASQKRKGAIILPDEISDLRRRLFSAEPPKSESAKAKSHAKRPASKKTTAPLSSSSSSSSPSLSSSSLSLSSLSSPRRPEPPYSLEFHHKNKQVLVDVTLHHVPAVHVNVSETTDEKLIVDTAGHTKKFRLELPMPHGLRVDAKNAACEMDCARGLLRCVLPIRGEMPREIAAQREKMIENIRKQKALRFRMGEDGALHVRCRRALLLKDNRSAKRAREEEEEEGKGKEKENEEEEEEPQDEENGDNRNNSKAAEAENNNDNEEKAGRTKKQKKNKINNNVQEDSHAETENPSRKKTKKEPTHNSAETKTAKKNGESAFEAEHRRAMSLAKAAGKAAQLTLRENIAQAKAIQQKRMERLQKRTDRREVRSERTQNSFARVLEEQKRQLLAQAELAASVSSAEKRAKEKRRSSGKTVSFAVDN